MRRSDICKEGGSVFDSDPPFCVVKENLFSAAAPVFFLTVFAAVGLVLLVRENEDLV